MGARRRPGPSRTRRPGRAREAPEEAGAPRLGRLGRPRTENAEIFAASRSTGSRSSRETLDVYSTPPGSRAWTSSSTTSDGRLTPEQEKGLCDRPLGSGLGGWHGGLATPPGRSNTPSWSGSSSHPGGIIDCTDHQGQKMSRGPRRFQAPRAILSARGPGIGVLATTTFSGKGRPGPRASSCTTGETLWKSRVFYASFRHTAADFDVPEARRSSARDALGGGSKEAPAHRGKPRSGNEETRQAARKDPLNNTFQRLS
jgi:hypothetical protein